jgi:hypothetical protein
MRLHTRKRRIARQTSPACAFEHMTEAELIHAGKAASFPANGAGWSRETLIRKLKELKHAS